MSKFQQYKKLANPLQIPKEMDALMLSGKGFENLQLCRVPVPEPNENQLLARVDAVFGCASDGKFIENGKEHTWLHGWDIERWPVSIGHEGCVTIVKAGKNLKNQFPIGQNYVLQPAIKSSPIHYRERYANHAEGIDRIAIGYTLGGLFAEYILITEEVIQTKSIMPYNSEKIPYFAAAFSEPLSCVYAAQNHVPHIYKKDLHSPREVRLGLKSDGITLVMGAGPLGILHADLGMMYHPRMVIISEPVVQRREQAAQILTKKAKNQNIALKIVHPDELAALLKQINQGKGVDDCIVAVGVGKLQEQSIQMLAPYGVANFFGGTRPQDSLISVDARKIHYENASMVGSSGGDPSDVKAVMELIADGVISPNNYVKRVGGLDQAFTLVKAIKNQEFFGKGLIYPHVRAELKAVESWSTAQEIEYLEQHL